MEKDHWKLKQLFIYIMVDRRIQPTFQMGLSISFLHASALCNLLVVKASLLMSSP